MAWSENGLHAAENLSERGSISDTRSNDSRILTHSLVFADLNALRFIADSYPVSDQLPQPRRVEDHIVLEGFQVYFVEQWARSRKHITSTVVIDTGDPKDKILVWVLRIPAQTFSQRLSQYLNEMITNHANPRETLVGTIYVIDLSLLSSDLNMVSVIDGNVESNREIFVVNSDLRRLCCACRNALSLEPPTDAQKERFYTTYKLSDRISITESVIGLISVVQSALAIYGLYPKEYIDGFICDRTEVAILNFLSEIAQELLDLEIDDENILSPRVVAALLGLLLGTRYRLRLCSISAPKDVCDVDGWQWTVASFKRQQKLSEKNSFLNLRTLHHLRCLTDKGAQKLLGLRSLRTQMQPLSRTNHAHSLDIETIDLDGFIQHLYGDRLRYLWFGKSQKNYFTQPMQFTDSLNSGSLPVQLSSHTDSQITKLRKLRPLARKNQSYRYGVNKLKSAAGRIVRKSVKEKVGNTALVSALPSPSTGEINNKIQDILNIPSATMPRKNLPFPGTYAISRTDMDYVQDAETVEIIEDDDNYLKIIDEPVNASLKRSFSMSCCLSLATTDRTKAISARRLSFSLCEDAIFLWDPLFKFNNENLELQVDRLRITMKERLDIMNKMVYWLNEHDNNCQEDLAVYQNMITRLRQDMTGLLSQEDALDNDLKGTIFAAAKLRYESKQMVDRLAEVEDLSQIFDLKISRLEASIDLAEKADGWPTFWCNFLKGNWIINLLQGTWVNRLIAAWDQPIFSTIKTN